MAETDWKGITYGNATLHRWLIRVVRLVGTRFLYLGANLFVIPACFVFTSGWHHIFRYLRHRHGYSWLRAVWGTYRNLCLFAQVVIDRFAMYAGRRFKIDIEGYEHFRRLAACEQGFLQLSAHVGNYELAGYSLVAERKTFNALVFAGEKETVMQGRKQMFSQTNIRMIPVTADGSHVFRLNEALLRGDVVSMPGDRLLGSKKSLRVKLLGGDYDVPMGPFAMASLRSLDALAVNVMKVRPNTYKIYVTPLTYDHTASPREQMQQLADAYAAELERVLRLHPTQWYNYYAAWREE